MRIRAPVRLNFPVCVCGNESKGRSYYKENQILPGAKELEAKQSVEKCEVAYL